MGQARKEVVKIMEHSGAINSAPFVNIRKCAGAPAKLYAKIIFGKKRDNIRNSVIKDTCKIAPKSQC